MIFFMNKEIEIKKALRNFLLPKLRHNRHILGKYLNQILGGGLQEDENQNIIN